MLPLLLLASVSRCASSDLCPTDAELISAVSSRDISAAMTAKDMSDPTSIVMVSPRSIKEIADVHCGEALPNEEKAMNCSFTVIYPDKVAYQVAKMSRDRGHWIISEALVVTRFVP